MNLDEPVQTALFRVFGKAAYLEDKAPYLFVFEQDGTVLGLGAAEAGWIKRMYVDPAHHHRGIGKHILAHLEDQIGQSSETDVYLYAFPSSVSFYRHFGYEVEGSEIHTMEDVAVSAVRMYKHLRSIASSSNGDKQLAHGTVTPRDPTFRKLCEVVMNGLYLTEPELRVFVRGLRSGSIDAYKCAALLCAMETRNRLQRTDQEELGHFIDALTAPYKVSLSQCLCNSGTGGESVKTVNISTPASLIIASAGIRVCKNGSKGTTGAPGSAEILQGLGINPYGSLSALVAEVGHVGIGYFDFSKLLPVQARTGVKTPLNIIGPLCNPTHLEWKILGCVDATDAHTIELAIQNRATNYIITCGPHIDELSLAAPTLIIERRSGTRREYLFDPLANGLPQVSLEEIAYPGSIQATLTVIKGALEGQPGGVRDVIAVNAGLGIYLAGIAGDIREGYDRAQKLIDGGMVLSKLGQWTAYQHEYSAFR
jgi:anthranilate phosphoribosyltransferase